MTQPLLEVEDFRLYFHTRDGVVKAVDGVSYTLERGQTLGVVGESGSGKSVTALSIMGLNPMPPGKVESGDIRLDGKSLLHLDEKEFREIRGNRISMIFQDPMTSLNPVQRVGDQIGEPLRIHQGLSKKEARAQAAELLTSVGIPKAEARVKDYPHQFSGGMRQRAMIAMALACDPDILIADEPTTALDVTIQAQILDLIQEVQKRSNAAVILITHDLGVVADMADQVLVMYAGKPAEFGEADDIFYNARHPYTWGLHDSLPRHDKSVKGDLHPIKGQPPSLINVPSGCAFHPRCPYAQEVCRTKEPRPVKLGGVHTAACHFAADPSFVHVVQEAVRVGS